MINTKFLGLNSQAFLFRFPFPFTEFQFRCNGWLGNHRVSCQIGKYPKILKLAFRVRQVNRFIPKLFSFDNLPVSHKALRQENVVPTVAINRVTFTRNWYAEQKLQNTTVQFYKSSNYKATKEAQSFEKTSTKIASALSKTDIIVCCTS